MQQPQRSTIALDAAAWLRNRPLPWRRRWTFVCVGARCIYCGGRGDLGAIDLCEACLMTLPWLTPAEAGAVCSGDRGEVRAVFAYQAPINADLRALKFRGDLRPARVLGALCAAGIALSGIEPQCIVPVPLHALRLRERGFNQTSRLARELAAWLGVPVQEQWLTRCRSTAAQTSLSAAERRRNVQGAFALARPASCRRILLLDDVLTTGATLQAASAAFGDTADLHRWTVSRAMPMKIVTPT
ncbi:MAG: ComF family protein [Sinobacteraceae bacterium]|nr:ComF family protein [Nevskiaceae bacterium]